MIGIGSGFVALSSYKNGDTNNEPISVLDTRWSPSPSTSTSTHSGSGSGEVPAPLMVVSGETHLPETGFLAAAEMEVAGDDDWEAILSDSCQDQFLPRWISSELIQGDTNPNPNPNEISAIVEPPSFPLGTHSPSNPPPENPSPQMPNLGSQNINFSICSNEPLDVKPQFSKLENYGNLENFSSHPKFKELDTYSSSPLQLQTLTPHQPPLKRPNLGNLGNLDNFNSHPQIPKLDTHPPQTLISHQDHPPLPHQPPLERLNLGDSGVLGSFYPDSQILELDKHPPQAPAPIPQRVVYDELYIASELIMAGNLSNAHSILARLNHRLTPGTKPFQRASFYLKEALLQLPLLGPGSGSSNLFCKSSTPVDGLFKMGAYKLLSEVSPLTHFVNFTSNQAILEAVGESDCVHVIDFDIGSGAQWASFLNELPLVGGTRGSPCLKITAFASPLTHHHFELGIMHENLTQFANEIGVNFELEVVNLDAFDPNAYPVHLFKSSGKETTLAVNFPIWAFSNRLSALPSLIRFVKQLSPKIVVAMERGCERTDLPFSYHLLHSLQYYEALLDSVDASKTDLETISKIEKLIIRPKIEDIVLGRLGYPDQMPHWSALFAAAGFSQVNISNLAEIQAECVLKKTQARGFQVKRRQSLLMLSWQCRVLVSASAWRC